MTRHFSRRAVLGSMGAGAALAAFPAVGSAQVAMPTAPLILRRKLERELSDGKWLTVNRGWRIEFDTSGRGMAIFGSQIDVVVDAPSKLAALAKIERERSTSGMFPILLDADGLILAAGQTHRSQDMRAAVAAAAKHINAGSRSPEVAQERRTMVRQLSQQSSRLIETLPQDLFFPKQAGFSTVKPVTLPDGARGEFSVSYDAKANPGSGLLSSARRTVETRLAGTVKRSRETWTLS